MTRRKRLQFTMNVITGVFCFGILSLWVPGRWALAIYQCALFALAAGWGILLVLRPFPIRWPYESVLLAAAVMYSFISLCAGLSIYRWTTWESVLNWGCQWLVFFFVLQFSAVRRLRVIFLRRVLVFAFVVSLLSVLQNFTSGGRIFWIFPSGYTSMVFGPFVYPNQFAAFVEAVLPLALYHAVREQRTRLVYVVMAATLAASVVAAASRAGCAFVLLEMLVVPYLTLRSRRPDLKRGGQLVGQLLIFGIVAILTVGWGMLRERLELLQPVLVRRELTISSFHMLLDRPWFGFGLGNWPIAYPAYARYDDGTFVNQAHNDWMQWAVEGGLPFVALLTIFAGNVIRPAWRCIWGLGVAAVLLHCLVDYPMQQRPALAGWFFGMMGAVSAAGAVRGSPSGKT